MDDAPLKPQTQLVLDFLKTGKTLSNVIALMTLGVGNLTTRIAELRKLGHPIIGDWKADHHKRRYKSYSMKGAQG